MEVSLGAVGNDLSRHKIWPSNRVGRRPSRGHDPGSSAARKLQLNHDHLRFYKVRDEVLGCQESGKRVCPVCLTLSFGTEHTGHSLGPCHTSLALRGAEPEGDPNLSAYAGDRCGSWKKKKNSNSKKCFWVKRLKQRIIVSSSRIAHCWGGG